MTEMLQENQHSMDDLPDDALALNRLGRLFQLHRQAVAGEPFPDYATRLRWLAAVHAMLVEAAPRWTEAVSRDFGHRSPVETQLLELFPAIEAVRHAKKQLARWMKPRRCHTGIWFQPGRSRVLPQPKGGVGVIVPWNYPVYLAIGPLVSALAAGNRVLIKTSELTPATGALLREMCEQYLGDSIAAVVEGGPEVARRFSAMPFDHLLFTGSTAVGRLVMAAASTHLTPVTLELGGKSPVLVAPGQPLRHVAERIIAGKLVNAGQTCIAPDYVLVPRHECEALVNELRAAAMRAYPVIHDNPDYSAIISERHRQRLQGLLEDAGRQGARIVPLSAETGCRGGKLAPALVLDAPAGSAIMQEEIFGPLLPVVTYDSLDAAVRYIAERPHPLALYLFDHDNRRIGQILAATRSGGVTLNDTLLHIAQDDLPFSGIGPSGMGAYHGQTGFDTFSHLRAVFAQSRWGTSWMAGAPYGKRVQALLRLMVR